VMSAAPAPTDEREARPAEDDGVRWLALLLRQGLKLIVAGIERRYGIHTDTCQNSRNQRQLA
jgi:hypothetical protein